jgi:hypothetical protein
VQLGPYVACAQHRHLEGFMGCICSTLACNTGRTSLMVALEPAAFAAGTEANLNWGFYVRWLWVIAPHVSSRLLLVGAFYL